MIKIPKFKWKNILTALSSIIILLVILMTANGCASTPETSPVSTPIKQESKPNQTTPIDSTPVVAPETKTTPTTPVTAPVVTPDSTPKQTTQSTIVYGTKTGSKYHSDGCRSLSKSKIQMSLSDAKSSGLTPCSICKPPQ